MTNDIGSYLVYIFAQGYYPFSMVLSVVLHY